MVTPSPVAGEVSLPGRHLFGQGWVRHRLEPCRRRGRTFTRLLSRGAPLRLPRDRCCPGAAEVSALDEQTTAVAAPRDVLRQAARRRTFAVISHPDAGKSTLTEALALHARVINEAGAIHGKAGRKSTVSDWMDIEKARGISISSAALQ